MEKSIRVISVERGHDPRDFTLVTFSGAGPLPDCDLASVLDIPRALVPRFPGTISALGMHHADVGKDYSQTALLSASAPQTPSIVRAIFARLESRARREMSFERFSKASVRIAGLFRTHHAGNSSRNSQWTLERNGFSGFRVRRYLLRNGPGGAGKHRGREGIVREIGFLTGVRSAILCERRRIAPWGISSGKSGVKGRNTLIYRGKPVTVPSKANFEARTGRILRMETPGGGGWGRKVRNNTGRKKEQSKNTRVGRSLSHPTCDSNNDSREFSYRAAELLRASAGAPWQVLAPALSRSPVLACFLPSPVLLPAGAWPDPTFSFRGTRAACCGSTRPIPSVPRPLPAMSRCAYDLNSL
jgi:hypothetical protein